MLQILLIEDDPELRELLTEQLDGHGHQIQTAAEGEAGANHLLRQVFDVVICDVQLPRIDGLTLFRRIRQATPATDVIMMTAHSNVAQAVSALKDGAYDYLTKPFDVDELLLQVRRIDETRALRRELENVRGELAGRGSDATLRGESPAMQRVRQMIQMVAESNAPTMITGESGTGKEVVARLIHAGSARRDKPFVAVNCGALAENLIEAELFGHERGAFTGAVKKRDGRFKAADGGTLLLDEVAELPLAAQTKLLRVLQEGVIEPLGTNTPVRVDVRILSATHRNLSERIKSGQFREDLFYRINVIEIPLPPLRERPGDLPLLLRHFISRFTAPGAPAPSVSASAWAALARYPFPGNVRELSHAVEHAMVLSGGRGIDLVHLPPSMLDSHGPSAKAVDAQPTVLRPLQVAVREFEHQYLRRALKATRGKRARTAELLGISRKTLWEKLRGSTSSLEDGTAATANGAEQEATASEP